MSCAETSLNRNGLPQVAAYAVTDFRGQPSRRCPLALSHQNRRRALRVRHGDAAPLAVAAVSDHRLVVVQGEGVTEADLTAVAKSVRSRS